MHVYTQYWYLRPFGASLLLAGYDAEAKRHELYCVEPNGTALRYFGFAIGAWRGWGRRTPPRHLSSSAVAAAAAATVLPSAAGKGQRAAKTEIEKGHFEDKSCEEALGLVAKM